MPARVTARSKTVNGALLNASIRHALYVQRYGSHLVGSVVGFLNDTVFPDVLGRLVTRLERIKLRGYDSGAVTTQRYRDLLGDVSDILDEGIDAAGGLLRKQARELAKVESEWARKTLQDTTPGALNIKFDGLNLNAVQQVVNQPIQGRVMQDWWDGVSVDTQKRIEREIGTGLSVGETVDQMVQRVRGTKANGYQDGVLQTTRRTAEGLVRTVTNHVSTQAREQTYLENDDVIKGIEWVSTLDTRTTPICQRLDGKVFPINEGERPPAHWNCRSTTVPVLKSWKELGIKAKEADPSTRASMDGQVAESLTYSEWLAGQDAETQDEALGPRRASLYRRGIIDVADLANDRGRSLTLEELERRQ